MTFIFEFSAKHQKALALAPHITAPFSMAGSALVIKSILSEKKRRGGTYQRLLFAMSCIDFLTSFWMGLSTIPAPRGTAGIYGASGNTATCAVQGFFVQLSIAMPIYNASLSVYYLLLSRFRWEEDRICAVEPYMHATAIALPLVTAIVSIPLKLFNHADIWCWIAPLPQGCKDSHAYGYESDCIRGDNASIYKWAFVYAPIWICIAVSMVAMLFVYWTVLAHERAVDKFQDGGLEVRTQSKKVACQSFLYMLAFYISWLPGTLTRVIQEIPAAHREKIYYPFVLLMAIFLPLQGFLNFIVYSRSRYLKYKRDKSHATKLEALAFAALSKCPEKSGVLVDACGGGEFPATDSLPQKMTATEHILQPEFTEKGKHTDFNCNKQTSSLDFE